MPFSLSALHFNTNNLDSYWTIIGETNTLTAPALCLVSNGNAYIWEYADRHGRFD
jgi:fructose/tagatose bisphosphate aldolase